MVGYRSFFFFFFCLYTFTGLSGVQVQDLAGLYGNKYANLMRLKEILADEHSVFVPAFIGIDTDRIETFLRSDDFPWSRTLFDDYRKAIIELNKNRSFVGNCINRVLYAVGFKSRVENLLQAIQEKISLSSFTQFDFSPDERIFFKRAVVESKYLMVRSTGIEDSQTVANAGGNVSIAYVQPVEWKIQEAMKQVVASYFSMQSLKNRIAGGEQLSTDDLCLPVLIQLLVGEPLGGSVGTREIPISGVAFTTNLNISAPDFPIMEINAAYGHGEGVVANRVATDRYYITPSRTAGQAYTVYPVVSYKGHRLVAQAADNVGDYALVAINNSADLAQKRVLSEEDIERLYKTLKKIETAYGQPMDVEFVILDSKLYIVQARPAMHSEMTPSYVTLEHVAENGISDRLSIIPLVTGQSKVVQISDVKEIIIAKTLDEADQMPNSAVCKAVFVENWAASLSHAAVNFMSHGIPCFYVSDINTLKKVVNRASVAIPLIIDVQRRLLFLWNGKHNIPVTTGWFEHPIDRTLSVCTDRMQVVRPPYNPMPQDAKIFELLEELKNETSAEKQLVSLNTIVERIVKRLALTEHRITHIGSLCDKNIKDSFMQFQQTLKALVLEYKTSIECGAQRFEILFYHKMLEALIFQNNDEQQHILDAYTYTYFLNELYAQQAFYVIMRKFGGAIQSSQEFSYARYCASPEMADQWRNFLCIISALSLDDTYASDIAAFKKMLAHFEQCGCLPLWFATTFHREMNTVILSKTFSAAEKAAVISFLKQSTESYTPTVATFVQQLEQIKNTICATRMRLNAHFADSSSVEIFWKAITDDLIQPLTAQQFIAEFKQSPLVVQLLTCTLLHETIDCIDAAIKMVKMNTNLLENEKIELFKSMLSGFNGFFRTLVQDVMPEYALDYNSSWPLNKYLDKMQELYDAIIPSDNGLFQWLRGYIIADQRMFQRSPEFAVNAAVLGSATAFERHYPQTAEDLFMLIHQNALATVAAIHGAHFKDQPLHELLMLPSIVQDVVQYVASATCIQKSIINGASAPVRIGIQYNPEALTLSYNMALSNHSSTFQIIYDTTMRECTFAVQFLGQARTRWQQIAFLAFLSKDLSGLTLCDDLLLDEKAGIVSWRWVIQKSEQISAIIDYLATMGYISNGSDLHHTMLADLYKGIEPFEIVKDRALSNYERIHGATSLTERFA